MLEEERKTAYSYIKHLLSQINWVGPEDVTSDEGAADVLEVKVGELVSLKQGLANPSQKLVDSLKKLVGPMYREEEIDNYLVNPFRE